MLPHSGAPEVENELKERVVKPTLLQSCSRSAGLQEQLFDLMTSGLREQHLEKHIK